MLKKAKKHLKWVCLLFAVAIVLFLTAASVTEKFSQDETIYILTRTSKRPKFFKECRKSIKEQTYKNWKHVVSADDEDSYKYAKDLGDKNTEIVKVQKGKKTKKMNCPYNLYNNKLLEKVPQGSWVIFLDDDSKFINKTSLQNLNKAIIEAEKNDKNTILSHGGGRTAHKPHCWGMSAEEIIKKMDDPEESWHFTKIDTSHIAIKKTKDTKPWSYECAGDAHFFYDNLKTKKYKIAYNEKPIIAGNYIRYGGGNLRDI